MNLESIVTQYNEKLAAAKEAERRKEGLSIEEKKHCSDQLGSVKDTFKLFVARNQRPSIDVSVDSWLSPVAMGNHSVGGKERFIYVQPGMRTDALRDFRSIDNRTEYFLAVLTPIESDTDTIIKTGLKADDSYLIGSLKIDDRPPYDVEGMHRLDEFCELMNQVAQQATLPGSTPSQS